MIKHIVMFKFVNEAEGRSKYENMRIARDMLNDLQGVVPTLKASKVSLNSESADKTNYDLVLEADFDTFDDLQAYVVHPKHQKVGEFLKSVRESRACVDYEY